MQFTFTDLIFRLLALGDVSIEAIPGYAAIQPISRVLKGLKSI